MLTRIFPVLACLALGACAMQTAPQSTAQLPPFFYGTLVDNDIGAINEASWALGSPARTRNDPVEALRTAIAIEYLSGELNAPRWYRLSPLVPMDMQQARREVRQTLGIRQDVPSQAVVNTLVWALWDLAHGNRAGTMQVLSSPIFTRPAAQTWQVLNNLPPLPAARAAVTDASEQEFRDG